MARIKDREKALVLRGEGKSYSQIKEILGISKSTLHYWLKDHPLSNEQIRELRDWNPRRIENFRNTMHRKRELRLEQAFRKASRDIKKLNERDLFVAGFFLFWAEGTKTSRASVELANTDPALLRCFITWLELLGVPRARLKARLHLYSDMDAEKQLGYWARQLRFRRSQFRKPYIKQSASSRVRYRGRFGNGTCVVRFGSQDMADYVLMGVTWVSEQFKNNLRP